MPGEDDSAQAIREARLFSRRRNDDLPQSDEYLTDGKRLFRVAGRVRASRARCAELEDCESLQVWLCTADDLKRLKLRIVRGPGARQPVAG